MSAGHTSGPWKKTGCKTGWRIRSPLGCLIAVVERYERGTAAPDCEHNARLIAAAPKMYEALKRAQDALTWGHDDGTVLYDVDRALKLVEDHKS